MRLSAGGALSGYYLNYGEQKLFGPSLFVDADTFRHFGVEGEARWLTFHRTNDEHAATYLVGPRYSRYYWVPVGLTFPTALARITAWWSRPGPEWISNSRAG
jgi:hypothetical protein